MEEAKLDVDIDVLRMNAMRSYFTVQPRLYTKKSTPKNELDRVKSEESMYWTYP
jgi:hypothetical protein